MKSWKVHFRLIQEGQVYVKTCKGTAKHPLLYEIAFLITHTKKEYTTRTDWSNNIISINMNKWHFKPQSKKFGLYRFFVCFGVCSLFYPLNMWLCIDTLIVVIFEGLSWLKFNKGQSKRWSYFQYGSHIYRFIQIYIGITNGIINRLWSIFFPIFIGNKSMKFGYEWNEELRTLT